METHVVLKKSDFNKFLDQLSIRFDVYVPVKSHDQRLYKKHPIGSSPDATFEVRPFEPLKAFFSRARERVAKDFGTEPPRSTVKPLAIVGAKACDLKGLQIQDFVFQGRDFLDPFYAQNRQENLIIGADCGFAIDTCFCLAVGAKPHPQADFDLNLSSLPDGVLIEIGSNKGRLLIEETKSFLRAANQNDLAGRDKLRAEVIQAVEENLKKFSVPTQDQFPNMIEKNFTAPLWEEEAKTCVECGACTNICPTCHCFLLYDQKNEEQMSRLRVWDSCMVKDYARVAGGGNPRKKLWMRLRNRFEKKFDYFPKVLNVYACTGCGRCISACPAKIDIRRVLKRLVNHG